MQRTRFSFFVLAVLVAALVLGGPANLGARVAAQQPGAEVPASVLEAVNRIVGQPRYKHSLWGVAVGDLDTGQVLYQLNADKMFVPGSIMKTYSTATVLDAYDPDHRFTTPVYRDGAVVGGALRGNLILVASGDMSMGLRERADGTLGFNSAPELDHSYANNLDGAVLLEGSDPLAALNELAMEVRAAGIREVRGDVVIDDRLFETNRSFPDNPIAPIWINENLIDILITPRQAGRRAQVTTRPQTAAYRIEASVRTVDAGQPNDLSIDSPKPGVIRVRGQIAADAKPLLRVWRVEDPADFARTLFIEALGRAGVMVRAALTGENPTKLLRRAESYEPSERVAEHVSAPLSEITKVVLKVSHNPGANLMTCLSAVRAGSRNCEQGLVSAYQLFTRLGVSRDSTFAFDGAGSDERDRTTPIDMITFVRGVAQQPFGAAFRRGLPILGVDGTTAETAKGTPAAGRVFVKTGSRGHGTPADQGLITGLTIVGYADAKSGRRLTLAVMVRDVAVSSVADIFAVDADQGAIALAIQQGY